MRRLAWLSLLLAGCELVSSSTEIELDLDDREFTIDVSRWQLDAERVGELVTTSCGGAPGVCGSAAELVCERNCSAACNATTQSCDLALHISLYQPVNLVSEQPALRSIDSDQQLTVTLDSLTYEVTANTLDIATPELALYVAPMTVLGPGAPEARRIATIAPLAAGATTGALPVAFTPTGKADLIAAMAAYKTPFNVIVGGTLEVTATKAIPTGRLDAVVRIRARAGI